MTFFSLIIFCSFAFTSFPTLTLKNKGIIVSFFFIQKTWNSEAIPNAEITHEANNKMLRIFFIF